MISMLKKVALITVAALPVMAVADVPAKEAMCRSCHGAAGAKPILPAYPKLAGQNKEYLIAAIKACRGGSRKGGIAAGMGAPAMGGGGRELVWGVVEVWVWLLVLWGWVVLLV